MAEKIVIALGGNALQNKKAEPTAEAQLKTIQKTCEYIADISAMGYEIGLVHGNGPQVGRILLASETAKEVTPPMPFDVCGAMSQGYIGYQLQQSLKYALSKRNLNIPVVTIATQVMVDQQDRAFRHPSKPIGPFYSKEEAEALEKEKHYVMKEDAGRGFRRVVASPQPRRILEIGAIRTLWPTTIVIAVGGGGIPVVENPDGTMKGVAAVIDKDLGAELLAEEIGADYLMILTDVEKVAIHYGKPEETFLSHMSLKEAAAYMKEGHFSEGSMMPKVEAAMRFVRKYPNKKAIITSLDKAVEALNGQSGTAITFS